MSQQVFEIPLQPRAQTLSISLSGITYQLSLWWCAPSQCWVMDISDNSANPILFGVPLITGADLLAQYAHLGFLGQLIVQTDNDGINLEAQSMLGTPHQQIPPNYVNLGINGHLYYLPNP